MISIRMEKLPKNEAKLIIEVPVMEVKKFFDEAILKLSKNVKIKGFRAGKAPKNLLKEKIGKERIISEMLEIALPITYYEAVKLQKIIPLMAPKIEIKQLEEDKPLIYEAKVAILPPIKIPNYKNLKIKAKKIEVKEEEVENLLRDLQKKRSILVPKEGEIKKGDWTEIDFKPINNPDLSLELVNKLSSQSFPLIVGEANFVPGFEDQLIGLKKGEYKEFEIVFPNDFYMKEIANKKITFFVKINEVQKVVLPEIDDKFAQSLGNFKTLLDLKIKLRENLLLEKEEQEKERLRSEVMQKITALTDLEVSPLLIEQETERLMTEFKNNVKLMGMEFEEYLKRVRKTEEDLKIDFEKQAEQNIKTSLVLNEISKIEEISVTEEEIEQEVNQLLLSLPGREEEIKKWYNSEEGKQRLISELIGKKTIDRLVELMVEK